MPILTFRVLDHTGDTSTPFNIDGAAEIDAAMQHFMDLVSGGGKIAYISGKDGAPGKLIQSSRDIDTTEDATIVVSPMHIGG